MPSPETAPSPASHRIAFIGGGNMARSLIGGLRHTGMAAADIAVAEPIAELRAALARDFGVEVHAANDEAARFAELVVLAVKPQVLRSVCLALRDVVQARRPLVLSIAAGVRMADIERWLGGDLAVVRAMPNTPALIGEGASALCANPRVPADGRALAERLLGAVGLVVWLDDESAMDIVTALSGSGPAYFFLLVEALEDAAVAEGLPRAIARTLAAQTCLGAGRMLRAEHPVAPAELRRRVTSPGGTTQAALDRFAAEGFTAIVARALHAATERGRELARSFVD
jgi:pyrroline-5-carboxylate reductase